MSPATALHGYEVAVVVVETAGLLPVFVRRRWPSLKGGFLLSYLGEVTVDSFKAASVSSKGDGSCQPWM